LFFFLFYLRGKIIGYTVFICFINTFLYFKCAGMIFLNILNKFLHFFFSETRQSGEVPDSTTNQNTILPGCKSVTHLGSLIKIPHGFVANAKNKSLKITATLINTEDEKGCGRTTYNFNKQYEQCGFRENYPLLPSLESAEDQHAKYISKRITLRGISIFSSVFF